MLHTETVTPYLWKSLTELMHHKSFADFRLVGGTALSLLLGHRMSVDIDMFTDVDYGTLDLESIKCGLKEIFPYIERLETLDATSLGYTLYCGDNKDNAIKLDLFYTDKFSYSPKEIGGIRIADVKDIAAMKILAVDNSNRKKDYWDIHELLGVMSIDEMIGEAVKRYPYVIEASRVLNKLKHVPVNEIENVPINCLKGKYWEFVVEDIEEAALLSESFMNRNA